MRILSDLRLIIPLILALLAAILGVLLTDGDEGSFPSPSPSTSPRPAPSLEAVLPRDRLPSPGPRAVTCPSGASVIKPGDTIVPALKKAGAGGSVCFKPGIYRLTAPLNPESGQTLTFETGAVLNGSEVVTDWVQDGSHWVASGQTQRFTAPPVMTDYGCRVNSQACIYEDVFMDGQPLQHVPSLDELGPGRVYFDKAASKIFIADDPQAHAIEATVAEAAIVSQAAGVTIAGATIDKFAHDGIDVTASNWTITDSDISRIHFGAIDLHGGRGHVLRNNRLHHNGVIGMTAASVSDLTAEGNEVDHNNYLSAGPATSGWHEGGIKILKSRNVLVRNNYSHHNDGDGIWFDFDNIDITIEDNLLENNTRDGIVYEASFDAIIRRNVIRENGLAERWYGGTGIRNSTSKNVEYSDNLLEGNMRTFLILWQPRGSSPTLGERQSANVLFHDNTVVFPQTWHRWMWIAVGVYPNQDPRVLTSNNLFEGNHYFSPDASRTWWHWEDSLTWEGWQSLGLDKSGSYSSI
jgi:hypothetical protein